MKNNNCIRCTVENCAYHSKTRDCCSLPEIEVGCSCAQPTDCQGTECASFRAEETSAF